jgi:uracil-DNA glycosylase
LSTTANISPQLEESWKEALLEEFGQPYFAELKAFLVEEKKKGITIYPPGKEIFNAFNYTPFKDVKVVIIGQDPYHGVGQAHGLSFSVKKGVTPPPSLKNIFKEIQNDLGIAPPNHGELTALAKQGVLLLNATLTVRAKQPGSHQKKGWENFTDSVIKTLSDKKEKLVFLLWGRFAQDKAQLIDTQKHTVLTAAHPSPYSASNGFFGCKHFSKTNAVLTQHGLLPIDWSLI